MDEAERLGDALERLELELEKKRGKLEGKGGSVDVGEEDTGEDGLPLTLTLTLTLIGGRDGRGWTP